MRSWSSRKGLAKTGSWCASRCSARARAAVGAQRQALALAEQLVQDNRFRVEVGTKAPIDVGQAQSEAAARRQLLALAVEPRRSSELIVEGISDELWNSEPNPTDQPRIEAPIDLQEAIRGALERRTDVSSSPARDASSTPTRLPSTISATAPCRRSPWPRWTSKTGH